MEDNTIETIRQNAFYLAKTRKVVCWWKVSMLEVMQESNLDNAKKLFEHMAGKSKVLRTWSTDLLKMHTNEPFKIEFTALEQIYSQKYPEAEQKQFDEQVTETEVHIQLEEFWKSNLEQRAMDAWDSSKKKSFEIELMFPYIYFKENQEYLEHVIKNPKVSNDTREYVTMILERVKKNMINLGEMMGRFSSGQIIKVVSDEQIGLYAQKIMTQK